MSLEVTFLSAFAGERQLRAARAQRALAETCGALFFHGAHFRRPAVISREKPCVCVLICKHSTFTAVHYIFGGMGFARAQSAVCARALFEELGL